ncbi:MAG: tetratricopeptide repeat protein [Proteobacteria bacterium]|nr:tetratricopeptide repeat protein [Pseudomonadota bacterium]
MTALVYPARAPEPALSAPGRRILWTAPLAAAALACAPALAQTPASKAPPSLAIPATTASPTAPQSPQGRKPPGATPAERAAYDKAFQATLDKPSDPDTLARFADLAVKVGDIEGAISALERLLLIDANQPEVKLELGVLYYRLGSKEAALTYLEGAHASPEASQQVRDRAEEFLKAARR